jgi:hypothetical protein
MTSWTTMDEHGRPWIETDQGTRAHYPYQFGLVELSERDFRPKVPRNALAFGWARNVPDRRDSDPHCGTFGRRESPSR